MPFAAYLAAVESRDPDTHADRLAAHARQLRAHVDTLAGKAYWEAFEPSPEFVVLFVPGDPFLEAALQADPALLEHAFGRNVVIATPTTLIALLRTVAYGWRQEALARNAAAVHQLGRELHGRLATMGTHVAKLGRSLDGAVDSYNQTVSSLEARVLVTARQADGAEGRRRRAASAVAGRPEPATGVGARAGRVRGRRARRPGRRPGRSSTTRARPAADRRAPHGRELSRGRCTADRRIRLR